MIIPYENELRVAGLAIIGFLAIFLLWRKPHLSAGYIMGFGWYVYFATNVGFVLDAGKLIAIVCMGYVVVNPRILASPGVRILFHKWLPYIIYCSVLTVTLAPFWPHAGDGATGVMYTSFRWFVQLVLMALGFCSSIVIAGMITNLERLRNVSKVFIFSMGLLGCVGLYQYVAFPIGLPINPITRQGGESSGIAAAMVEGEYVFRSYSFAGEPKGLAAALCLPVVLLAFLGDRMELLGRLRSFRIPITILFATAFYLTLSTAGYIIICGAVAAAICGLNIIGVESKRASMNVISLVLCAVVGSIIYDSGAAFDRIGTTLNNRVSERIEKSGMFTYAEEGVIEFWKEAPEAIITGVGRGGSSFYIRKYRDEYRGYTAAARGVVGDLADVGIIGVVLLYVPLLTLLVQTGRRIRIHPLGNRFVVPYLLCVIGIVLILTTAVWIFSFAVLGLASALAHLVALPSCSMDDSLALNGKHIE